MRILNCLLRPQDIVLQWSLSLLIYCLTAANRSRQGGKGHKPGDSLHPGSKAKALSVRIFPQDALLQEYQIHIFMHTKQFRYIISRFEDWYTPEAGKSNACEMVPLSGSFVSQHLVHLTDPCQAPLSDLHGGFILLTPQAFCQALQQLFRRLSLLQVHLESVPTSTQAGSLRAASRGPAREFVKASRNFFVKSVT